MDFNSRAHVERDAVKVVLNFPIEISTHALTWSATDIWCVMCYNIIISTHALTWSATQQDFQLVAITADFNSRAHVERDNLRAAS